MTNAINLVFYADGSTRPQNPGYTGFGVYGYSYKEAKRPKNTKHPSKAKYNFTSTGISEEKDVNPYEVIDIYEHIGSVNNENATNNIAELLAFIWCLETANSVTGIQSVKVITDSNYVVSNYNDHLTRWKNSGWLRADGKPISHKGMWETVDRLRTELTAKGITIDPTWVKGHSDDYGNDVADLYSVIGSNYARQQLTSSVEFNEVAYNKVSSYREYKDSLTDKDIVFYFRDLFFSSATNVQDINYCFISTSDDPLLVGKRDTSSIFLTNVGYVPPIVNDIKAIFRSIPRNYVTNCCIKLSKLEDRDTLRLARNVGIAKMLYPRTRIYTPEVNGVTELCLVKDTQPFVSEYTYEFPYIVEASGIFSNSINILSDLKEGIQTSYSLDVTSMFVEDGKLLISNVNKEVDLTDMFNFPFKFVNRVQLTIGRDIPGFIPLKSIENQITKVSAVVEVLPDSNYASLYMVITTPERDLCTINITNKFLIVK